MKRITAFFLMALSLFVCGLAFGQSTTEGTMADVVNVPWFLWIFFLAGYVMHWFNAYQKDHIVEPFLKYFFQVAILRSIAAFAGGILTFAGMYALAPAAYPPGVVGAVNVFLLAYTWDSLANSGKKKEDSQ